jgi:hypothetical protein
LDCSVFAESGVSRHRALCWLVREAVDRRGRGSGPAKGRYKRAYRDAEAELLAKGAKFSPLDGDRLDMLIAKPNAELWASEVETLTLIANHLIAGLAPDEVKALEVRAVERARSQPGSRPGGARSAAPAQDRWSPLYEGVWRERQHLLAELGGEYLIFRHQHGSGPGARTALIVSHLTIEPAPLADGPARYRTLGAGSGKDERVVEGWVYESNAAHGVLVGVGRDNEMEQVRNAMLVPVAKPLPGGAFGDGPRDLKGMRLSIGRFSGEPVAYRIWASRLTTPPPGGGDWRRYVKDYVEGEPLDVFEQAISGFGWIRAWLARPVYCVLDEDGDPPTP